MKLTQSICALQLDDEPGSWQAAVSKRAPTTTTTLGTIDLKERSAARRVTKPLGAGPCLWASDVLPRILIEGFLAARRAEVIGIALLERAIFRMVGVDPHAADRIDR